MAYEANRDPEFEKARADANNANTIRNAADVAIATKNPYGVAAGVAVKGADALTDGKASEALGKAMTKANQYSPGGNQVQNLSNNLSESGLGDKIGQAAAMKNQIDARNGGGQGSLPSSNVQNTPEVSNVTNADNSLDDKKNNNDNEDSETKKAGLGGFVISTVVKVALVAILPLFFIILIYVLPMP